MKNDAMTSLGIIFNEVSKHPSLSDQAHMVLIYNHVSNVNSYLSIICIKT